MAQQLERTTFETSRLMEFFSEKELSMQIGHDRDRWPLALVKELVDNALDACEAAGVPPEITVTVDDHALSVADNGSGLPAATIERSLDYLVRVSDKNHYVSPTRGQLGNALKCVWAAPFVATGEEGRVEVHADGRRHVITVGLDRIAQSPALHHEVISDGLVRNGTLVKIHWPLIAGYLRSPEGTIKRMLTDFAAFNPHAAFAWHDERSGTIMASDPGWRKWRPAEPTSPHWYGAEQLRDLLAAYLIAERKEGAKARTVREFVAEFRGLSGTAKQQAVTTAWG